MFPSAASTGKEVGEEEQGGGKRPTTSRLQTLGTILNAAEALISLKTPLVSAAPYRPAQVVELAGDRAMEEPFKQVGPAAWLREVFKTSIRHLLVSVWKSSGHSQE